MILKKMKNGMLLFGIILIANLYASAVDEIILGNDTRVLRQHQWTVIVKNDDETVFIYDNSGKEFEKLSLKGKGKAGMWVSTDINGDCIVNRAGSGESNGIAFLFSNSGEEKWRYNFGLDGGGCVTISPDGKYAMITMNPLKNFTVFSTSEPMASFPNPFVDSTNKHYYISHFTKNNDVVLLTSGGELYGYDPSTKKIKNKLKITTPQGNNLRPALNEWVTCQFANENQSLFSTTMIEMVNDTTFKYWLFVYDDKPSIKRLSRLDKKLSGMQILDSQIVATAYDKRTAKWNRIFYRDFIDSEIVVDSNSNDEIGATVLLDSSLYSYSAGEKGGVCKYDFRKHISNKGLPDMPLMKNRTVNINFSNKK